MLQLEVDIIGAIRIYSYPIFFVSNSDMVQLFIFKLKYQHCVNNFHIAC